MLALAALVLAFAKPFIPATQASSSPEQFFSLYIDNSPSMQSGDGLNTDLNLARNKAAQIIDALPADAKIQIVTNHFNGREQRYYAREQAKDLIDGISPSFAFRSQQEISERIKQLQQQQSAQPLHVFWLSDFQQPAFNQVQNTPESWKQSAFVFQQFKTASNIAIDSVWFDSPVLQAGFKQVLQVQLSNFGSDQDQNTTLSLKLNNSNISSQEVTVQANGSSTAKFSLPINTEVEQLGELKIQAEAPYFDNTFYFTYQANKKVKVLLAGNPESLVAFSKLFNDSLFEVHQNEINALDYSQLSEYDLVVLNSPKEYSSGLIAGLENNLTLSKNVLILPNINQPASAISLLKQLGINALQNQLSKGVGSQINYEDPHFKDVFSQAPNQALLPQCDSCLSLNKNYGFPLIVLDNGNALISRFPKKEGNIFVLASDLQHTNLAEHPIFVPLMLNAALYSGKAPLLYTLAGKNKGPVVYTENTEIPVSMVLADGEALIPKQKSGEGYLEIYDLPSKIQPQLYPLFQEDKQLGAVAVNSIPSESDWRFLSKKMLQTNLGIVPENIFDDSSSTASLAVNKLLKGTMLWKWFVLAALGFLTIEILLIKFWK